MARHAGFGAVATVIEQTANDAIASYARGLGPLFFPLPTTIPAGPITVTLNGIVQMLAPTIELHVNPSNAVTVHFAFRSVLSARYARLTMTRRMVQWNGTVSVGLVTTIQDNRIVVGIDTTQVALQPMQVQVLQGPPLPPPVEAALESAALAAAATAFVQSRPPITVSPPMLASQISHTQPFNPPWMINPSWFTISLTASQIVVRTFEAAITVAVDFAGFTSGNANELVDLTAVKGSGSIYKHHFTQDYDPAYAPSLSKHPEPTGGSIACCVSMNLITAIVNQQVSPQIRATGGVNDTHIGTTISVSPDISLMSVGAHYATFNKPPVQDGIAIPFHVRVEEGPWFGVDGTLYLQVYKREADGTTEFVYAFDNVWRLFIAKVDIDLPWWINIAVLGLTVSLSVGIPMIAPILGVTALALLVDVIPGMLATAQNLAQSGVQSAVNGVEFPAPWSAPLPGLETPAWSGSIKYVSLTPTAVDLAVTMSPSSDVDAEPLATITPSAWPASNKSPIQVTVKLRDDLETLSGNNMMVSWSVQRADTKQRVAEARKAYTDPNGNGVLVEHHTPELYFVDAFIVRCTVTVTLGNQTGEVWSGTHTLPISDTLDRHHKYVEWGPHVVHFKNEGTNNEWWQHARRSRIHRTAVSARCKMLREAALVKQAKKLEQGEALMYKDTLPFAWSQLNANRKPLCEYCFFGGPDKTTPLPQDDWF